jgi:outer membrane receptor protein involved in Fe transport
VRWGYNGTWSWFKTLGAMNHEIKSGVLGYSSTNYVETYGYPNQQIYRYRSLPGETNYFLHPDSVQVFEYPNNTNAGIKYHSWFANDSVNLTPKLTLNAGLRFDHYSSWLPEQGNPGTGPYAIPRVIPETHGFPVYNAWSPRLSAVYDITGSGRVALKASYGRYSASGSGVNNAAGPVAASVNPAATLVSTFTRWDGRIPYTPVAADLVSVTGSSRNTTLDPSLKGEYLDEFTGGVDLGFWRDTSIRINYVHKRDYRGNKVLNQAQPFEAYSDMVTGIDPGRDNTAGTADDGVVRVWSVPRTYPGFGQIAELTVNAAPGEGDDTYNAFEATFSKSYSNGWSLLASYSADKRDILNIAPRNPNEAAYNWEFPETFQGVRLSGTYELPWQMLVASTFTAQQGEYFNRVVQVRDALNTLVNVTVEGHAGRYDWVKLSDVRFSKSLKIKSGSLEGMVDVFNLFNSSVVLRRITTNGPNYNKPLASGGIDAASANPIPAARVFRLSARYRF